MYLRVMTNKSDKKNTGKSVAAGKVSDWIVSGAVFTSVSLLLAFSN